MKLQKNSPGFSIPLVMVFMLIGICMFSMLFQYLSIRQRSIDIKDSVENAVIAVAIENYTEVFKGEREGYTGAYRGDGNGTFSDDRVTEGAVYAQLSRQLSLTRQGSEYVKLDGDGNVIYAISGLIVTPTNSGQRVTNDMFNFSADVEVTIRIPMSIGAAFDFGDMTTTYNTKAIYRKRY